MPSVLISKRALRNTAIGAAAVAAFIAGGCGSLDPGASAADAGADRRMRAEGTLLPWATGNSWTYRVTAQDGTVTTKVTTVGPLEPVGGIGPNATVMANKVTTTKGVGGTDETISWQGVEGELVVRYREQAYSASTDLLELEEHWAPHKLHVDGTAAHTTTGATWLEVYAETKLPVGGQPSTGEAHDRWTVIAESESITVPAGTFEAVLLQKVGGSSTKRHWYVPRVGKVKETGGQTEELESYRLGP